MSNLPRLFVREYDEQGNLIRLTDKVTPGMEWVLAGEGVATANHGGTTFMLIDGFLFLEGYVKKGEKAPQYAVMDGTEYNPKTGEGTYWVEVNKATTDNQWLIDTIYRTFGPNVPDGYFSCIGPNCASNPFGTFHDAIGFAYGRKPVAVERTFDGIKRFLQTYVWPGLVFWKNGRPMCEINRSDFGELYTEKNTVTETKRGGTLADKPYYCSYEDAVKGGGANIRRLSVLKGGFMDAKSELFAYEKRKGG